MDERTEIASRLMAGLLAGNPEYPIMAATEIATKGADDLMGYLSQTDPGEYEPSPITKKVLPDQGKPQETPEPTVDGTSPNLRDLGVSGRACAPLERMGIETLLQLAVQDRQDIKKVRGVAVDTLKQFDELLEEHGLSWSYDVDSASEVESDDEDDLL